MKAALGLMLLASSGCPVTTYPEKPCLAWVYEGGLDNEMHKHEGMLAFSSTGLRAITEADGTVIYLPSTAEVICK